MPGEYSGRFVVRVTPSLHKALARRARAEGVSLNHLCGELLAQGIGSGPAHPEGRACPELAQTASAGLRRQASKSAR
ncbi:MAG: toxin-antitoxin system HicB family antitoxin [Bacillota bacterium]|nr:toxin-antitoxin system HicB family antitoxin [Bacillota bacterium]